MHPPVVHLSHPSRIARRVLVAPLVIALLVLALAPASVFANDAQLTIVKIADHSNATRGDRIGYRITVQIHPITGQDAGCVDIGGGMAQCPANNVVLTDTLPTTPAGLTWSINAATS